MKKICIIKLKSAGDVIRTTPILRVFSDCKISWITDGKSYPFIEDNPLIQNVLFIEKLPIFKKFDALYNFDEDEMACKAAESIPADIKKGYGWGDGGFYPFDKDSDYAYRLTKDNKLKFKLKLLSFKFRIFFRGAGFCRSKPLIYWKFRLKIKPVKTNAHGCVSSYSHRMSVILLTSLSSASVSSLFSNLSWRLSSLTHCCMLFPVL